MMRLYSFLAVLIFLSACSAFESHEERRANAGGASEVIDLTVEPADDEHYIASFQDLDHQDDLSVEVDSPYVAEPMFDPSQQERQVYKAANPAPQSYRVNKNVEVFSLD